MSCETFVLLWPFCIITIILFIIGFYCLLVTYNMIRALIGIEILIKAVTLLIIAMGYITKHMALAQAMVITLIVIEVVFITVAAGIIIGVHKQTNTLDSRTLRKLKG